MNFGLCSTLAWFKVGEASPSYVKADKTVTVAHNAYSIGGIQFAVTSSAPSGNPVISDDWGRVYYLAGSTATPDTTKNAAATYSHITGVTVTATNAPQGNEETTEAYNARNTDANLVDGINSLAGKYIKVTVAAGEGTNDSSLKFHNTTPTQLDSASWGAASSTPNAQKGWENETVTFSFQIVAITNSNVSNHAVSYAALTGGDSSQGFYAGVAATQSEQTLSDVNLGVVLNVSIVASLD